MNEVGRTDKHYRVVRYYTDFGLGVIADVLGRHLSREEAEKMAKENPAVVSDEDIYIEEEEEEETSDQDKVVRRH